MTMNNDNNINRHDNSPYRLFKDSCTQNGIPIFLLLMFYRDWDLFIDRNYRRKNSMCYLKQKPYLPIDPDMMFSYRYIFNIEINLFEIKLLTY